MRHLIIHRQRALMGFGLSYFCILDETRERFMERLEGLTRAQCNALEGPVPITNGATIELPLDEAAHTFLIALYPEEKNMVTREIPVPAGTEDVIYLIKTSMDMWRGIVVSVGPGTKKPELTSEFQKRTVVQRYAFLFGDFWIHICKNSQ